MFLKKLNENNMLVGRRSERFKNNKQTLVN